MIDFKKIESPYQDIFSRSAFILRKIDYSSSDITLKLILNYEIDSNLNNNLSIPEGDFCIELEEVLNFYVYNLDEINDEYLESVTSNFSYISKGDCNFYLIITYDEVIEVNAKKVNFIFN